MINCINLISFRNSINFDNKSTKKYNKLRNKKGVDTFVKITQMNENYLKTQLEKLNNSHKLKNSPVSYLGDLLTSYMTGKISDDDFKQTFLKNTRTAKVCLGMMSKNDIIASKKFFRNELILADNINFSLLDENPDKDKISKYIIDYNNKNS